MLVFSVSHFSGLCRGGKGVKSGSYEEKRKSAVRGQASYVSAKNVRNRFMRRRRVLLRYSAPYKYGSQEENSL